MDRRAWPRTPHSRREVMRAAARAGLGGAGLALVGGGSGNAAPGTTPATTHGAIESGRRAAAELLAARS